MKGGMQAALALGVGYVLGRRRKMRVATMLAAAAATGGMGGMVVQRAVKLLGSTEALDRFAPQLGELADTVRGELMDAGKAAATAAVTSQIESLADSLHGRAELIRDPGAAVSGASKAARSGAGEAARPAGRGARRLTGRGQEAAGAEGAGGPREEEEEEEEPYSREPEESEGYEPGDGEPGPAPVRRRMTSGRRAGERGAAPVRRRTTTRRRPLGDRGGK